MKNLKNFARTLCGGSSVYQQPGNQPPSPGSTGGPIRTNLTKKVEMMQWMQTLLNQKIKKGILISLATHLVQRSK